MSNRGRPVGYRLSECSKKAISEAKRGQHHTQATKDKISHSLILYFRSKSPLSDEMSFTYNKGNNSEAYDWISDFREDIDNSEDIMTNKTLRNICKMEIACGQNIEYYSHNLTPEVMILFKEYCDINKLNPFDVLDKIESEEVLG